MLRLLPHSDTVCVNVATMSALLMTLPRTGRLLPWDTQVSKHASVLNVNVAARIACPPTTCTWTTNDDLRLLWRRHATVIGGS